MSGSENGASSANSDVELTYLDFVTFVRCHSLALLGGAFMGSALGLVVAFALPVQWEAVGLLQVAQVAGAGAVEPPLRVVDRVMQESFRENVEKRMGVSPEGATLKAGVLLGSLQAKIEKSDLVGVRVRGATPEATAHFADAVVAELASVHAKMAAPTIDRWHKELDEVEQGLKQANSEAERLSLLMAEQWRSTNDNNLYRAVLASNILLAQETNLRAFRERKRALQEQLSPERTFPTAPLGQIEISRRPVSPKKPLFAVGGLVMGLFIGASLSVLKHAGTRRSARIKTD